MLNKGETIAFYIFLSIVLVGGINWGIEAFAGRDLFALIINDWAGVVGGSSVQDTDPDLLLLTRDESGKVIPRIIYSLVFASTIIVAALLIKSAYTKSSTGTDCVIPSFASFNTATAAQAAQSVAQ